MKKVFNLMLVLGAVLVLTGCSLFNSETHKPVISEVEGMATELYLGSELPDFTTYFTVTDEEDGDIEVTADMVSHNVPVNGDNEAVTRGIYEVVINVEDSDGEKVRATLSVEVVSDPNAWKITNFAGLLDLVYEGPATSLATFTEEKDGETNVLVADVTSVGDYAYSVNVGVPNLPTKQGKEYTISFTIKTDIADGRDVTLFMEDVNAGYSKYFTKDYSVTTEYQTFEYKHTMYLDDNDDSKLGLFLGNVNSAVPGKIYIKDFSITEVDAVDFVLPYLEDIGNVNFADALTDEGEIPSWETGFEAGGTGTAAIVDDASAEDGKAIELDITAVGGNDWSVQVGQPGKSTENGQTYTITYRIKADAAADGRTINFILEDTGASWFRLVNMFETVTTDWQEFTYTYVADFDNSDTKIGLLLGNAGDNPVAGKLYIDYMTVTAADTVEGDVTSAMAPRLDTPADLAVSDDTLTWTANSNAASYNVYIDGVTGSPFSTTTASFDLSSLSLADGNYSVTVKAISDVVDYRDSDLSSSILYTVGGSGPVAYDPGFDLSLSDLTVVHTWGDAETWTADGTLSVVTVTNGDWWSGAKICSVGADCKLAPGSFVFEGGYAYTVTIVYEGTEETSFFAKLALGDTIAEGTTDVSGSGEQTYSLTAILADDVTDGELAFNTGWTSGTLTIKSIEFTRV